MAFYFRELLMTSSPEDCGSGGATECICDCSQECATQDSSPPPGGSKKVHAAELTALRHQLRADLAELG